MQTLTRGLAAIVGELELRVVASAATFVHADPAGGEDRHLLVACVRPPGATIGRGEQADLRLVGPASVAISRHHLVVRATHRGWSVCDCSSNGTCEWLEAGQEEAGASWSRLPAGVALPVESWLSLSLAPDLQLRHTILRRSLPGDTTPPARAPGRGRAARIPQPRLERLALALLAPRRERPGARAPSPAELQAALHVERSTLYEQLAQLRQLPEVRPFVPRRARLGPDATADAVARAFPYLAGEE